MVNKKFYNNWRWVFSILLVTLIIFTLSLIIIPVNKVLQDNCLSSYPFMSSCFLLSSNATIEELDKGMNQVSYLDNLSYRSIIQDETLYFSITREKRVINMHFINNTNKVIIDR